MLLSFLYLLPACDHIPKDPRLENVDQALINADQAQKRAFARANSLAEAAKSLTDLHQRMEGEILAGEAYMSLDMNKALEHFKRARDLTSSDSCNHPVCRTKADIRLAFLYNLQGSMTKEASDIFCSINPDLLDNNLKLRYYILGIQLYKSLANHSFDPWKKKEYIEKTRLYRDSVLALDPSNILVGVNRLLDEGKTTDALGLMKANYPGQEIPESQNAPFYHHLAIVYRHLENPDSELYYLAKAATIDLNNGVKEYIALTELAELIRNDDFIRAYKYINRSAKDASESHSDNRLKKIGPLYREIHDTYGSNMRHRRYGTYNTLIFVSYIVIIILILLIILRNRNIRLKRKAEFIRRSKEEVDELNRSLKEVNDALAKESKVKEAYITSFMTLSVSYLDQLDKSRAELARMATRGSIETMIKRLNSNSLVNHFVAGFYENFDKAFLTLYPDFINKLNSLLRPENQYSQTDKHKLTTELRVYALIWLGINESNKIAGFLRCSESTVYNYRTKMRNRALSRDNFELDFRRLNP